MTGEKLVFLGNCQAEAISLVYRTYIAPLQGQTVTYVAAYEDREDCRRAIANADAIITQKTDFPTALTADDLRPGVKHFEFPMVVAGFLWPYASQPHIKNHTATIHPGPYPPQLGDAFLNQMIKNDVPSSEAIARYLALDIARRSNVDRLAELYMSRQRERDSETGYEIADLIERYMREEPLFLTPDHPHARIFNAIFARFCDQFHVPSAYVRRALAAMKRTPFADDELPIHPGIIQHFGLKFVDGNTRYRHFNQGRYTFTEFMTRYMAFEYDADLEKGIRLCRVNDDDAAFDLLNAGLKRTPMSGPGFYAMSVLLARRGDVDDAISAVRHAITLDPREWIFHAQLGSLLTESGSREQAMVSLRQAADLGDCNVLVCSYLAPLYRRAGDMVTAENQYRAVQDLDGTGELHAMLSHFLMHQERLDEAMVAGRRAMELSGESAGIRHHMGELLRRTEDEREARAAIAQTGDAGNAGFHADMGHLLLQAGDVTGAEQALRAAIEIAPDVAGFHNTLGSILSRLDRIDDASREVLRALELDGDNPDIHSHLRFLLHRIEMRSQAMQTATRAPAM